MTGQLLTLLLGSTADVSSQEPSDPPAREPPRDEPIELVEEIPVTAGHAGQTRFDAPLLQARAADGRWTVDAWAPLDGFVANGGVRVAF